MNVLLLYTIVINIILGYYTVFDRENKRVGFRESTCECKSEIIMFTQN